MYPTSIAQVLLHFLLTVYIICFKSHFIFNVCLYHFLHCSQGQVGFYYGRKIKSLLVPCEQTHVLPIEFLAQTRLAHIDQTNQSTLEIYGSWKVELMFIFNQIAKHNSKWHIWVCLLGYSKAGTTWAVYCLSQTESTSETVEHVQLVRPDTHLALSVCMHTIAHAVPWLPGLSVPDSIHFLPISLHAYFMSSN